MGLPSLAGRRPSPDFYTFPWQGKARQPAPDLELVLVHGCRNNRERSTSRLEQNLHKTARNISEQIEGYRVHIFGYDALQVLRKGMGSFQDVSKCLLRELRKKCAARVAIIAHNSAAWLVQDTVMEISYKGGIQDLPVGLVFFGLPQAPLSNEWQLSSWNNFALALAQHLDRRGNLTSSDINMSFSAIRDTMSGFKGLQDRTGLRTTFVACSSTRGIQRSDRISTQGSKTSTSTTGSHEDAVTVLISIGSVEERDILAFLEEVSKIRSSIRTVQFLSRPSSPSSVQVFLQHNSSISSRGTTQEQKQRIEDNQHVKSVQYDQSRQTRSWSTDFGEVNLANTIAQNSKVSHNIDDVPHVALVDHQHVATAAPKDPRQLQQRSDMVHGRDVLTEHIYTKSPTDADSLSNTQELAGWYFQKGDFKEARRLYESLIDQCVNIRPYAGLVFRMTLHLAQIAWLRGNHRDSERVLKDLNNTVDDYRDEDLTCKTAKWLALSQWKQGKYSEADKTIVTCFEKKPIERQRNAALLSTRALILASDGSYSLALELSTKAVVGQEYENAKNAAASMQRSICIINHARVLSELGRYGEAAKRNDEALVDVERRLGPKHFVTLDAASLRVWLLVVNNNTTRTGEEVQRILRQLRERFGEEHPSTLQTVQTLVLAYKNDGRYSDAEVTARYLLRKCKYSEELGATHPQTLRAKTILAEVLLALGDWEEAESIQTAVVSEPNAKDVHRVTLAHILRERGQWDDARKQAVNVLLHQLNKFSSNDEGDRRHEQDQMEELSGEEIPKFELNQILKTSKYVKKQLQELPSGCFSPLATSDPVKVYPSLVQTMQCVALCEQAREDANLRFAKTLLEKIHDICKRRLGEKHQFTISIEHDLAVNYILGGQCVEALELINSVIEKRKNQLGDDHPDYLLSRHQRAVILHRLGRWQEALKDQEFTLSAQQALLGLTHPVTVLSRYTLAGIYRSLSQLERSEELLLSVIKDQRRIFNHGDKPSSDHAIVLRSRARLAMTQLDRAVWRGEKDKFKSAEDEQQAVVDQRCQRFGHNHHLTLCSKNDLAQIKQAAGRRQEAEEIYKSLLESMRVHGKNTDSILAFQVRSNLATCYYEKGQFRDAQELQTDLQQELQSDRETDDRYIASTFNLALTYKALKESKKAYELLLDTIDVSKQRSGDEHLQTRELTATLAEWEKTS